MNGAFDLGSKIEEWAEEGLITAEQARALKEREAAAGAESKQTRVKGQEILVYLGSLALFLALAFFVALNWRTLGSAGRIGSILAPTVVLLALGWVLRQRTEPRLQRGAQALWLAGCLLTPFIWGVIFYEASVPWSMTILILVSSLLGTLIAALAYWLLPTVVQAVAFHLLGSASVLVFLIYLEDRPNPLAWLQLISGVLVGFLWLAMDWWLSRQGRPRLADAARLAGALLVQYTLFGLATGTYGEGGGNRLLFEILAFATFVGFIAASVPRQSQIYLYSGAVYLLLFLTYLNFEQFADEIGVPVALFISGVLLIALGLGTERLRRYIELPG